MTIQYLGGGKDIRGGLRGRRVHSGRAGSGEWWVPWRCMHAPIEEGVYRKQERSTMKRRHAGVRVNIRETSTNSLRKCRVARRKGKLG